MYLLKNVWDYYIIFKQISNLLSLSIYNHKLNLSQIKIINYVST